MNYHRQIKKRGGLLVLAVLALSMSSLLTRADTGSCGGSMLSLPFTDVPGTNLFFCAIAEAYFAGLTNGSTATTYSPADNVTREQMAAFITRTLDQSLTRGSRRAALEQWWIPELRTIAPVDLGTGIVPAAIVFDGADLWVANRASDSVSRVRASDGRLLQTWTGADNATDIIACRGRIFILGQTTLGMIYVINPASAADGVVSLFSSNLGGDNPTKIAFDGTFLWTAHLTSIVMTSPGGTSVVRSAGFDFPRDILFDGANLWVADSGDDRVKRVSRSSGQVLESIPVGNLPSALLFDGTNLWVTNSLDNNITVIRAVGGLRGTVIQTITGNGLNNPQGMAFDGERVIVTNRDGDSVSLFKATDFTPIANVEIGVGSSPRAACSDGVNFWISRSTIFHDIVRF